jgi:hypothetical protein
MDINFCKSVLPIPQYANTCWFTSILMCFLRSQNSRKLLLSKLKINDKSPKIMKIIYKLLVKTYIVKPEIYKFYENFDLHKFLKYFYSNKNIITKIIKKGNYTSLFLPLFTKSIGIKSLSLCKFDNNDDIYAGYYEYIYNYTYKLPLPTLEEYKKKLDIEFSKKITPDYIFITIYKHINLIDDFIKICNIKNFKNINYDKNLLKLKNFEFNGNYYKLDSCLLANYNKQRHSIAGITCKNNKYVYNGWISSTKDPVMIKKNVNTIPCELIKHDWEVNNKNDEFCLNPITCKLDKQNPKDLCFSFSKGQRTLFFVKTEKEFISNDNNISNSSSLLYPSITNKKSSKTNPLCKEWLKNKNKNPETKRNIKDTSPIYKKYFKLCSPDDKNDKIKKLCKEWIKEKNINPETKRKIKDTSPIYKKYLKFCSLDNKNDKMIKILNYEKNKLLTLSRKYNKIIQQYQDLRKIRKYPKELEQIDAKIEGYKNQLLLATRDISFIDNELQKIF